MQAEDSNGSFWQQLFRNTGIGFLNDINAWLRGRRHRTEQKKIVISTSPWLALSRCGVHVLPVLVSTAIVGVNLRQVFIGIDFKSFVSSETINVALLQVAAKLQELLIIASLATIVFQLLRDELIYGDGIPLGLLGAGIDFTKLSYFWSPELLGGARTLFKGRRKYRKIQLGLFIIFAGVLAVLTGPSCAVLLVPSKQDWPAGGTSLFLNGTKDEFWPVQLASSPFLDSTCSSSTGIRYGICPSGGFQSIWSHYAKYDHTTFTKIVKPYAKELSGNQFYWPIESMQPVSPSVISLSAPQVNGFAVQPLMSISVLLDKIMQDWWSVMLKKKHFDEQNIDDRQAASSNILTPIVSVDCSAAEPMAASNHTVQFPTFDKAQKFRIEEVPEVHMSSSSADHLQFAWVPLSASYESVTVGAILQSAWSRVNQSRLVVGCAVQAKWVPAHIRTDAYTFWEGWYPKNISFDMPYPKKGEPLLDGKTESLRDAIAVDEGWLKILTPPTPKEGPGFFDWGPSTIESILSNFDILRDYPDDNRRDDAEYNGKRLDLLASIIGSVFADGVSRVNVDRAYNTEGNPSQWSLAEIEMEKGFEALPLEGKQALKKPKTNAAEANKISVQFSISGHSYRHELVQILSMIVLFVHMVVAILHTAWTVARGKSSASWDSITEILVLAQNSKPAYRALENTAAGLKYQHTYAKKVTIRPTKLPNASEPDHLELLLEEEEVHADHEMVDVEHLSLPPPHSAQSSVSSTRETSSHPVNTTRGATWPTYRRHSSVQSMRSIEQSDAQISKPNSPLLNPVNQDLSPPPQLRVKEDYMYG
ncbi:uncharacterized protein KY384_001858 [Bacidia gigantensis]|uniref:uncharacterized protein n=1 Tax=Bacidia gigantensis TaxID=2732470 RepID=UPI001D049D52|nr:uncharacterized protein KY384_001858 [Bacidia gigantensis]KAG8533075.1 hypothetical protein KY384_001858 [Bacidia gigantensis]